MHSTGIFKVCIRARMSCLEVRETEHGDIPYMFRRALICCSFNGISVSGCEFVLQLMKTVLTRTCTTLQNRVYKC